MFNLEEIGFKVGPSFIGIVRVQLRSEAEGSISLTKLSSWIGIENEQFYPMKEGPNLKLSLKLGTC